MSTLPTSRRTAPMPRRILKIARAIGVAAVVLIAGLPITLAIPIETWRTGDQRLTPLAFAPVEVAPDAPRRLWIDMDAACGYGRRPIRTIASPSRFSHTHRISKSSGFRRCSATRRARWSTVRQSSSRRGCGPRSVEPFPFTADLLHLLRRMGRHLNRRRTRRCWRRSSRALLSLLRWGRWRTLQPYSASGRPCDHRWLGLSR